MRHGETDPNRRGLALGRADVPLNETGVRQAELVAQALANEPVVAVYASPLQRTMRTAEAIAAPHGVAVTIDEGFVEMDIGELEGMTFPEIEKRHPELRKNWAGPDGPVYRMPGSRERLVDVAERAWASLRKLVDRHEGETVCVVSHNFVILTLVAKVMGIQLANFRRLRHGVAAISTLDVQPERARALRLNDTCHLDGK